MQLAELSGIGSRPDPSVDPSAARVGEFRAGAPPTADLLPLKSEEPDFSE